MMPLKLIMSPIDFSEHSHDALDAAADLASCVGAEILLVHIVPAIPKLPKASTIFKEREYEEELHKDAVDHLNELARKLGARGVKARVEVGTANDVSMELLRIAEHNHVDLIAMATHGMTGWRKLAFGSVTDKVVRLATCPVLVLRARPESDAAQSERKDSVGTRAD
jgi:nucleotide-binding universal stress UspA family protein